MCQLVHAERIFTNKDLVVGDTLVKLSVKSYKVHTLVILEQRYRVNVLSDEKKKLFVRVSRILPLK